VARERPVDEPASTPASADGPLVIPVAVILVAVILVAVILVAAPVPGAALM
jgi:hypothetical protein